MWTDGGLGSRPALHRVEAQPIIESGSGAAGAVSTSTRRSFMAIGLAAGAFAPALCRLAPGQEPADDHGLADDLVLDFVRSAHTNLDRTRRLLERERRLVRVAWEWAPGDFETAIDAAAHTGSVEIVQLLLERGAAYTIFVAAVLGHLDVVRAVIDRIPALVRATGPHGIPLLDHALAGGEAAATVAELLETRGAERQTEAKDLPVPMDLVPLLVGRYQLSADGRRLDFEIAARADGLHVLADGRPPVRLLHQGQARFMLEGTPAEFVFEVEKQPCRRVLVLEGHPIGVATRLSRGTPEGG